MQDNPTKSKKIGCSKVRDDYSRRRKRLVLLVVKCAKKEVYLVGAQEGRLPPKSCRRVSKGSRRFNTVILSCGSGELR